MVFFSYSHQEAKWKGKIEEEDGVKVIKNPKEPMYGENVCVVEEDLKIGEAVMDENYMFSQISFLDVDNDENIYVADTKEMHVKVFDKNGKFLRVFGKEGQGPDEIGGIRNIQITAKNELIVFDPRNRKILYFSLEGKFLRSKDTGKLRISRLYCDSHDNYYIVTGIVSPPNPHYELSKFDGDMNIIITIAKTPAPNPSKPYNPFMPIFRFQLIGDDNVLYGYPESYELQIFNPEGKLVKKITREYDPVPVSEAEKEEWRKGIDQDRRLEFLRYHTPFTNFRMDDEGRIFVRTWEKSKSGDEYLFDVFDPEGKYIAKIPLYSNPYVIRKGKLYTIEEDDEGYHIVKRYKVTWKF